MPNSTQQPHVNINKDASNNDINNVQASSHRTDMQAASTKQDSTNIALLNWLGCLFFGFIPPLIIML